MKRRNVICPPGPEMAFRFPRPEWKRLSFKYLTTQFPL
ncbi:Hypothetical protein BSSP2_II1212 [Brucella suis bv. 2]|nr:hypothetical protein BM28_A1764 [Brucella melitensis M28]AEW14496.1 hypothetical protein BCA52141_I2372 [Brucella canis HSK A52141]AEW17085.1 hypothetical protein BAA13334_I01155 [Brucella abortus A13334]AIB19892.1 Hypothetical protein BSSP3_II1215 [Brucella suis bv. 2]AIB23264.1 Hypothetical protein BSPT1_II1201 [Brucella suis bv. 2]